MRLIAVPSLKSVPAQAWDRLGDPNYPFMEYAFLRGLEESGTVGRGTGWIPLYLLATSDFDTEAHRAAVDADDADQLNEADEAGSSAFPEGVDLLGAAAAYIKTDSYGEFIFDWSWASFFHRSGVAYYPKLVVAAPFTPATGPRILLAPELDGDPRAVVTRMLAEGLIGLAQQLDASSVHWLFTRQSEAETLADLGYQHRVTVQHTWTNNGYKTFDDFLATMKSRKRKAIKRERRIASGHGLFMGVFRGTEMNDEQWQAVHRYYLRGCQRYGSTPYLRDDFFPWLRTHFADRVLCSMARDDAAPDGPKWVAATLNFQRGNNLYGRYWGCDSEHYALHFELAFYRLIEHCIAQGWQRFEAGAGGRHKIKRGLEPTCTHSAHWIADPRMAPSVHAHIAAESSHMREHRDDLAAASNRRHQEQL